jgi:hypothetical protein
MASASHISASQARLTSTAQGDYVELRLARRSHSLRVCAEPAF